MTTDLRGGARKLIPYDDYAVFHNLGFFTPMRCTLCCDQLNDFADVSCGDAWFPELMADRVGTSVIVCRTRIGENLLQQAIGKQKITLESIESGRVRMMGTKRADYRIKSRLAYLSGKKLPAYGIRLPEPRFTAYPWSLQLFVNVFLARRCFWMFVGPLARVEQISIRLASKLLSLVGLSR